MGRWTGRSILDIGHPTSSSFLLDEIEEGVPLDEAKKNHFISKTTFYEWLLDKHFLSNFADAIKRNGFKAALCYQYEREDKCSTNCPGYNNAYRCSNSIGQISRDVKKANAIAYFDQHRVDFSFELEGLITVDKKYIFSPKTNKWRRKGSPKWYRSAGPKDFYERFVKNG